MSRKKQVRRTRRGRSMSPSRMALLELIEGQPEPLTLSALVLHTGLHENTVRGHLEQLLEDGYVIRYSEAPSGRGRPAWLWTAVEPPSEGNSTDYAQLAAVLAKTVHDTSPTPRKAAHDAGQEWGAKLARAKKLRPESTGDIDESRSVLVGLLTELGFAPAPQQGSNTVELNRCPLLQTAAEYPDVVCSVHLGLLYGAAEEIGVSALGSDLVPFAGPGTCLLHLELSENSSDAPTGETELGNHAVTVARQKP